MTAYRKGTERHLYLVRQADLAPLTFLSTTRDQFPLLRELGDGYTRLQAIEAGLGLVETCYTPKRDFAYDSVMESEQGALVVTISLDGCSTLTTERGQELQFRRGYSTVASIRSSAGQRRYSAACTARQIRLIASAQWLEQNLGEADASRLIRKEGMAVLTHSPTVPMADLSARLIPNLRFRRAHDQVLLRGAALTILAVELTRVLDASTLHRTASLPQRDVERLHAARDLIQSQLEIPFTLCQISKSVGLSETRLKDGFKTLFGVTPFQFLLELRMRKAWDLLIESGCNVGVAGYRVGYEHPTNFATAFKRYFGISPKELKRRGYRSPSQTN